MKRLLRAHARRDRVPLALRRARPLASSTRPIPTASTGPAQEISVGYEPAESDSGLFGGNSNWRGPIWFPVNYLLIESLRRVPPLLRRRLPGRVPDRLRQLAQPAGGRARAGAAGSCSIFLRDADGRRPVFGDNAKMQNDPHFRDHVLFYEYFHGDTGRGVGASHQTGWTGARRQAAPAALHPPHPRRSSCVPSHGRAPARRHALMPGPSCPQGPEGARHRRQLRASARPWPSPWAKPVPT